MCDLEVVFKSAKEHGSLVMDLNSTDGGSSSDQPTDLNDAYDSIVLCEDTFVRQGYQEGLVDGEKSGFQEGFDLGIKKGSEIGSEIAFYRGFARGWLAILSDDIGKLVNTHLNLCQASIDKEVFSSLGELTKKITSVSDSPSESSKAQKAVKSLEKLLILIEQFPQENPKDQDVLDLLNSIRAKFKQCCAVLKVDASYSASEGQLSF